MISSSSVSVQTALLVIVWDHLVGSRLQTLLPETVIYGTLEKPLHALNLREVLDQVKRSYAHPKIRGCGCMPGQH